jgi:hypothetical protein
MSQKGRREFLTSAAAVAAALAACTAPARRAQAQCVSPIYDESDIVPKVAKFVSNSTFRDELITFPAGTTPTMASLTKSLVGNTLNALTVTLVTLGGPHNSITKVTVRDNPSRPSGIPTGTYDLIPLGTTPPPPFQRSPVVLTVAQAGAGSFIPDWSRILLFVIPDSKDPGGHDISEDGARSKICTHPFGM